ncbi:ABC transporter permease [Paenibacillus oenotherae]|uniref:Transport permease protein n=2 Tax=Paenibacillus oenotherae TaxID=1435645 RepID=A0ABS7D551_9BACL|nr:ABC transporter permease [Paenibacillus oenotherae]
MVAYLRRNRSILFQFIKRETVSRYKGSYLGFLWTFLTPMFMLMVYTFVFSEIFQSKWQTGNTNKLEFAIIVFCGLTTYNIFAEVVSRSPSLVMSNVNYVKKVVFPLELFSLIALGSTLVTATINILLIIIFTLVFMGSLSWTVLLLPIVLLPVVLFTLGLSWLLSSLGVYLRDIGQLIGIAIQSLMLLSPIFYSVNVIPADFKWFYYINPITYFVEDMRSILVWGTAPDLRVLLLEILVSALICFAGLAWFRKTKKGFADVL